MNKSIILWGIIIVLTGKIKPEDSIKQEWNAESYNNNSTLQTLDASKVIDSWSFKGDETILDLGCATGDPTILLAQKTNNLVIGIDGSATMVEVAQKKHQKDNLSFETHCATTLDFENKFDLIFSFNCLHWIENKKSVFEGLYRALKPGGYIVLVFSIKKPGGYPKGNNTDELKTQDPMITVADELKTQDPWKPYFINHTWPWSLITRDEALNLFEESGFTLNKNLQKDWIVFMTKQQMIDHFRAVTWLENLPKNKQPEFVQQLVDTYAHNLGLEDNDALLPYEANQIYIIAQKDS